MSGALSDIRVLDLTRVLAGPWAAQVMGDLGAEVIKVERPGRGDDTRGWGPPYLEDAEGRPTSESAYFLGANRNKRSVEIDISRAEGQEQIRQLVAKSDVLLENFKVGDLARYGLDYDTLSEINPRLVYCSITGFGQNGPYVGKPGYDFLIQAMGGLMSITGRPDDQPGGGPMKSGVALTDITTGLYALVAVLAALNRRHQTGQGQYIDVALFDVQVACLANQASAYLTSGRVPRRMGNAHPSIVPYEDFPTADGEIILTIGNDQQFARFCEAAGQAQWKDDARFATNAARVEHRKVLVPLIRQATVMRTTDEWVALLDAAGVPCGPVNSIDDVFRDPQAQHRDLRITVAHPLKHDLSLVASPLRLSESPVAYRRPPPMLGEHTDEVLREILGD